MKWIQCKTKGCQRGYDHGGIAPEGFTWYCMGCRAKAVVQGETEAQADRDPCQDTIDMSKLSPKQQMVHWRNRR